MISQAQNPHSKQPGPFDIGADILSSLPNDIFKAQSTELSQKQAQHSPHEQPSLW